MTDTTPENTENTAPEKETVTTPPTPQTPTLSNEQRTLSLCTYLIPLVTSSSFIAPLIIWLLKKGEDSYIEQHAKESLNFQITFMIFGFITYLTIFILIGFLLFPAVLITYITFSIIASIKAYKGETYKIPVCIHFIK